MKVLVTGSASLLWNWLIDTLVKRGDRVACIGADKTSKNVTAIRGTLDTLDDVVRAFNEYETDVCYHVGAVATGRDPLNVFETEIRGAWHVLEAARLHKPLRKMVFASSDRAYGDLGTRPATENV